MKKVEWRKIFDTEIDNTKLTVFDDWITYGGIGFNPKIHYKEVLREHKKKVEAIKLGQKKWKKEFLIKKGKKYANQRNHNDK